MCGQRDSHGDHGVHPLAHEEVVEDASALVGVLAEAVEREVVSRADEGALDPLECLREVPAIDERDDDADVARPAGDKARGVRGDNVPEVRGGLHDPRTRPLRDVAPTAQRARRRRFRHASQACDVCNCAHGSLISASRTSALDSLARLRSVWNRFHTTRSRGGNGADEPAPARRARDENVRQRFSPGACTNSTPCRSLSSGIGSLSRCQHAIAE